MDPPLQEGSLFEGRYRIDRVVGSGGFGVVYAGRHLALEMAIAVKVVRLDTQASADFTRFLDEARTLSRLRHPNIVRVLDAGIAEPEGGGPLAWLVMEWCEGRTLAAALRGGERRSAREVWQLLRPLLDAVAAAHAHGVIHRDIKPANVMLVDEPRGPSVRLIDFGIAKEVAAGAGADGISTRGPRAFTPAYAAPEQWTGSATGPATDVHALALLITERLVGARPFGEPLDPAAILRPERPTPRRFGVDVGGWEPVLERALALRPADRYADAAALLEELDRTLPAEGLDATVSADTKRAAPPRAAQPRGEVQSAPGGPSAGRTPARTEAESIVSTAGEIGRASPGRRAVAVSALALLAYVGARAVIGSPASVAAPSATVLPTTASTPPVESERPREVTPTITPSAPAPPSASATERAAHAPPPEARRPPPRAPAPTPLPTATPSSSAPRAPATADPPTLH